MGLFIYLNRDKINIGVKVKNRLRSTSVNSLECWLSFAKWHRAFDYFGDLKVVINFLCIIDPSSAFILSCISSTTTLLAIWKSETYLGPYLIYDRNFCKNI